MTYRPLFSGDDAEVTAAQYEAQVSYREWVMGGDDVWFMREYADAAVRAYESVMNSHAYVFGEGDDVDQLPIRWEWHGSNVWSYTHHEAVCYARWNGSGTWTYAIFNETNLYDVLEIGTRSGAGLLDSWAYTVLSVLAYKTAEHDYRIWERLTF